ncbi:MAG: hypothetical protein ABJA74_08070 [Lapillicoccus sp.]
MQRDDQDPAEYAELWAGDAGARSGTPGYEDLYAAWLADFADRGVERVGFSVVALRRRATERPAWTDLVDHRTPVAAAMRPVVDAGLRARTWLAEHDEVALLEVAWVCAPDVTEERYGPPGAADPAVIQLRQRQRSGARGPARHRRCRTGRRLRRDPDPAAGARRHRDAPRPARGFRCRIRFTPYPRARGRRFAHLSSKTARVDSIAAAGIQRRMTSVANLVPAEGWLAADRP